MKKDVNFESLKEEREYTIHGNIFNVIEDVYYCSICHSELINDTLYYDLKKIYNEYL